MQHLTRVASIFALMILTGCISSQGTLAERQNAIQLMKQEVLTELFAQKADVRDQIRVAAGYGVFSNANVNLIITSFGGGYGILTDNATGRDIYMKMGEIGFGPGLGVKDFRIVMIFHTDDALRRFQQFGFSFGAQADASARAGAQGGAIGGEVNADNVTMYQLTQNGLALQATIKGAKFWEDADLN